MPTSAIELLTALLTLRQALPPLQAHVKAHFGDLHRPLPGKGQIVRNLERALDESEKIFKRGQVAEAERRLEQVTATLRAIVSIELDEYRKHQRGERDAWNEGRLVQALNSLGSALMRLSITQWTRRAEEESLRSLVEANEIYLERLNPRTPEQLQNVAVAAGFLREHLDRLGHGAQALGVAAAVVGILRHLSERNPADRIRLADALKALVEQHERAASEEGLLPVLQEWVDVNRQLVTIGVPTMRRAAVPLPTRRLDLADALSRLGKHLLKTNHPRDATVPFGEALEIRRALAAKDPATHENALSVAMFNLSTAWLSVGEIDEATTAMRAVIDDVRRNPARRLTLAMHVADLGMMLTDLRPEEALPPTLEAIDLYRALAAEDRPAWLPALTKNLLQATRCLTQLERWPEARAACEEALHLWPECSPAPEDEDRSHALLKLAEIQLALDEPEAALATMAQAAEATDDGGLKAELIYHRSRTLSILERHAEQRAALLEAIELYWAFVREDHDDGGRTKEILAEYLAVEPNPSPQIQALAEALDVDVTSLM